MRQSRDTVSRWDAPPRPEPDMVDDCEPSAAESEPEIKKLRKDSNSVTEDTNVLLDRPHTDTLLHGIGKECFTNHSNAFGEHTMVVRKEDSKTKNNRTVYIWDMDETLILLKSLLNGKYAESFNGSKDVQHGIKIGRRWERHILQVCDEFFFYEQGLHKLLDNEQIQIWQDLYDVTDAYTDGWLSAGRVFLEECLRTHTISRQMTEDQSAVKDVNVLVTSGTLIPSLVKCLLFRLDGLFTYENVYSSWDVGKLQCFLWIKKRFEGPGIQFCVIGDSMEECQAAESLGWPFVKIDPHPSGVHRFPGLSLSTVKHYLHCIYDSSQADDEER